MVKKHRRVYNTYSFPGSGGAGYNLRAAGPPDPGFLKETTMPASVVKTEKDEKRWSKAKRLASEQGHDEDWAYIMGIFQRMKGKSNKEKMQKAAFMAGYLA